MLSSHIDTFLARGQVGPDPLAQTFAERRAAWSLFTPQLSDRDIESLRRYLFPYSKLPVRAGDSSVRALNFIGGEWRAPKRGEFARMTCPADRRVVLAEVAASSDEDVQEAIAFGHKRFASLAWADEPLTYRKHVVANLSRILLYYYEEILAEIRAQIPKTRLEADKDFWEGKRACDHLGGTAEKAMIGDLLPSMLPGHTYWKTGYVPAGLCVLLTPMNFIYGIPLIQIVGCYLSGSPFIYKGHPFAAISNTVLIRMLLAAGADPAQVQKVEGFGKGIARLGTDPRVAVVSLTGASATAEQILEERKLGTLRFEGGGCNWCYVDDGYSDAELDRIAERLTYAKLGFSSHKCTSLHGVAASLETLGRLTPRIDKEMGNWKITDPRFCEPNETKIVGPAMVHRADTQDAILAGAKKAGARVVRSGGRVTEGEYAQNAEVLAPSIIEVTPELEISANWDQKGERSFKLATTELFAPTLCVWACPTFERFLSFSLIENPHDLATAIFSRDDKKLHRARQVLAGMLKENDGTDSALEWEEFGASGIGPSGNSGVGDATATIGMFCRRQKGRHITF
jgi:betaine-aldehyde dehydrogenase